MCSIDESQISERILSYLSDHPDAQDTLEGIVEWWLLEQDIKHRTAATERALAELTSRGLILKRLRNSVTYYMLNRRLARKTTKR